VGELGTDGNPEVLGPAPQAVEFVRPSDERKEVEDEARVLAFREEESVLRFRFRDRVRSLVLSLDSSPGKRVSTKALDPRWILAFGSPEGRGSSRGEGSLGVALESLLPHELSPDLEEFAVRDILGLLVPEYGTRVPEPLGHGKP
jgi:hypothetical protein